MKIEEKLNLFQKLKQDLGERVFKTTVAKVYSDYYVERMIQSGQKIRKTDVQKYVNNILKENGSKGFSYSYYKKLLKYNKYF